MENEVKVPGALVGQAEEKILSEYEGNPQNTVVRHALSRSALVNVIYDPSNEIDVSMRFSLDLKTMPVCNQKQSGRCWIFAGLNFLRELIAKKIGIKRLELSQNYISLYDKIEKCNYALETILLLGDRDHDDRELSWVLRDPVGDGGQWDMFVNLVKKYGLMPKDAFPETSQSESTRASNIVIVNSIRKFASEAAPLLREGKLEEARALKESYIEKIYHFLLNCFGVPPQSFDFEYEDEDGYKVERGLTPKAFFEKYIGNEIDDYVSLINSPTADKPFYKNYTIQYLGNVVEGKKINHLNIPMERMKELILNQLKDGTPVWFGSDVGFYRDRESWSWNDGAFDYESAFGLNPEFEKGAMLDYWNSAMNHAMLIAGVNLVENVPTKWKIENSWGSEPGDKGYFAMSASWFDKFVYQAVVHKKFLNSQELAATMQEPTVLHPWDPMGTLAD